MTTTTAAAAVDKRMFGVEHEWVFLEVAHTTGTGEEELLLPEEDDDDETTATADHQHQR
jgi:hypothetical protein